MGRRHGIIRTKRSFACYRTMLAIGKKLEKAAVNSWIATKGNNDE